MEYADTTEKIDTTNSSLFGLVIVLDIVLLFVSIVSEVRTSYARHDTHEQIVVSK